MEPTSGLTKRFHSDDLKDQKKDANAHSVLLSTNLLVPSPQKATAVSYNVWTNAANTRLSSFAKKSYRCSVDDKLQPKHHDVCYN